MQLPFACEQLLLFIFTSKRYKKKKKKVLNKICIVNKAHGLFSPNIIHMKKNVYLLFI